jgi:hypothetical protein
MPRRARTSKRRPSSYPPGYRDLFDLDLGPSPRVYRRIFEPRFGKRWLEAAEEWEVAFHAWRDTIEASAFRLSMPDAHVCTNDKAAILEAIGRKPVDPKDAAIEAAWDENSAAVDAFLSRLERVPPPERSPDPAYS